MFCLLFYGTIETEKSGDLKNAAISGIKGRVRMAKQKLIVLIGPTASGKTALSIRLAKRFNAEIISGDSMQVYRGMDIGTAKITQDEMEGVPHHLIDIKNPDEPFSVAEFQQLVRDMITVFRTLPETRHTARNLKRSQSGKGPSSFTNYWKKPIRKVPQRFIRIM